jgi:hypothetical protein
MDILTKGFFWEAYIAYAAETAVDRQIGQLNSHELFPSSGNIGEKLTTNADGDPVGAAHRHLRQT